MFNSHTPSHTKIKRSNNYWYQTRGRYSIGVVASIFSNFSLLVFLQALEKVKEKEKNKNMVENIDKKKLIQKCKLVDK